MAVEVAVTHHEKWNGTGYPKGLRGKEIPVSGRVVAVADVYDALRAKRVYKLAFAHNEACRLIRESSESHFDRRIEEAFIRIEKNSISSANNWPNASNQYLQSKWELNPSDLIRPEKWTVVGINTDVRR